MAFFRYSHEEHPLIQGLSGDNSFTICLGDYH